jgi:predicted Ser/Thr protein kinase
MTAGRKASKPPVRNPADDMARIAEGVERRFKEGRRVLAFSEYLDLFATAPDRYARDASRYVRDVFDYYGTTQVKQPWGTYTRYRLFDLPWEPAGARGTVIGQEHVQEEIYRALSNFVREGRPNRLVLLHGPNGSAKSTMVAAIMRALEDYSTRDEGALYRFHWVFPSSATVKGSLGFAGRPGQPSAPSYAHLPDDQIDAKLLVEVRDHPLFLVPVRERKELLERLAPGVKLSDWILRGELSHKSQQVFEALLASYKGSYADVLRHVQVERYFISQRYRVGAITVGPQMSVDAGERQVTADRSLGALPPSLQALSLYEAKGELIEAAGGVLEFSDLLKRPLDAFKYLQLSVETGEVALTQQNVSLNCVMMGSANELHLDAFREHPEFASFRGRLELIRTPYLRSYREEQAIYDALVVPHVQKHVAPHATRVGAMFAVLTRMRKPDKARFDGELANIVADLSAMEKMELYTSGVAPERLSHDARKTLVARIEQVFHESNAYPVYEGRIGASPREMRVLLLDAAQSPLYESLSPLAVLDEIEALCERTSEFEWLAQERLPGGYHDVAHFQKEIFDWLIATWESEMFSATGIVDEASYADLFERYIQHVSVWVKKERIRNKLTGEYEEPDENLMREVEGLLSVEGEREEWRKQTISTIAAWAIEHTGEKLDAARVFPAAERKIKDAIFSTRRVQVAAVTRDIVILLREAGQGLDPTRHKMAVAAKERLISMFGYNDTSASDMASMLLRKRFGDLITT